MLSLSQDVTLIILHLTKIFYECDEVRINKINKTECAKIWSMIIHLQGFFAILCEYKDRFENKILHSCHNYVVETVD